MRRSTATGVLALLALTTTASAQAPVASPVPIRDNSFLVEEAYNQPWGVVQHVSTFQRVRGAIGWGATFTQEWPAPSERHQLSYTIPVQRSPTPTGQHTGLGDILLNYRYQVPFGSPSPAATAGGIDATAGIAAGPSIAASPRLSVIIPTGREEWGQGSGGAGLEVNFPLSVELSSWLVSHSNLGGRWTSSARNEAGDKATARGFFLGQSLIWLIHPKLNLMVESIWTHDEAVTGPDETDWERGLLIAPGFRGAIDFPSGLQIVPGVAVPLGVGPSDGERGVFIYISFEHPFRRQR
jgi:hypothetical protein